MELSFNKTFSPVIKIIASGGFYFPGSDVLYPRFSRIIRILTHILFVNAWINLIMETVNQFIFMTSDKGEGMTDLFLILSFGVASPTYIFLIHARCTIPNLKRIIYIWEKEMTDPPYPEDRKAEIYETQKYLYKMVKAEIFGFIIPLTLWSARTIVIKEPTLPVAIKIDVTATPAKELITLFFGYFGFALSTLWCTTENIKLMFMKCILAEVNHLEIAGGKIFTLMMNEEIEEGTKPTDRAKELSSVRKNLRNWIIYHQKVLRFSNEINNFIAPVLFLQEMCSIIFAFTDIFITMTGKVPVNNALSAMFYCVFYIYIMYETNTLGDEIRVKSANIMDSFYGEKYYFFTKDIIKNVNIIQFTTMHRPINLKALWYKKLSRKSLAELASKGYEILTFMNHLFKRNQI